MLVHGIAGFGKTVLAAEAVRDEETLGLFPGKLGGKRERERDKEEGNGEEVREG